MPKVPEIYFDEDGWYYDDYDGYTHGPFPEEGVARTALARYMAQNVSCPTCRGE